MQDPVVAKIASHIERVGAHGVPAVVRSAVITFVADTLAVGIAGLAAPWRPEILDMLSSIGGPGESTVFGSGERLPLMHAAMLNAYQIHSQEFDCLHENAVVHPMAAVLPVLLGWAEREGGVSGALDPRHGGRGRCRGDTWPVFARCDAVLSAGQCVRIRCRAAGRRRRYLLRAMFGHDAGACRRDAAAGYADGLCCTQRRYGSRARSPRHAGPACTD